jgi:hypothetical protein
MNTTASNDGEVDAALAALVVRCRELIESKEPQGLALMRALREALTDLYAALIRLPGLGIHPAMTWLPATDFPSREETDIRNQLIQRLPIGLYWSALRPLKWETVADTGVKLVADALLSLRREVMLGGLRDEVPALGGPILALLTILQELVSDLEAYDKA